MTHIRTRIREFFINELRGKTIAGEHVYDSKIHHLTNNISPIIIIYTSSEEIETATFTPRTQYRQVKLNVECYMQEVENLPRKLDELTGSIENIILNNGADKLLSLDKKIIKKCILESIEMSNHNEIDQPISMVSMLFKISYQIKEGGI